MKKKEFKLVLSEEEDIKFHGRLTYREIRIIAWIAMALSVFSFLMLTASKISVDEGRAGLFEGFGNALQFIGSISMPLFLLANFSLILQHRDNYKKIFLRFGGFALALYVGFIFVYFRYGLGIMSMIFKSEDSQTAQEMLDGLIRNLFSNHLTFNIFIDMTLCCFVMFFICYKPSKHFQGKKIILFRLMVAIPLLYEVASMVLRVLNGLVINLPIVVLPLLSSKPLLVFLAFVAIIIFLKLREKKALKLGYTEEEYMRYSRTNKGSLGFSIFVAILFVATALLDLILYLVLFIGLSLPFYDILSAEDPTGVATIVVNSLGFGDSFPLILATPIVIFYSYMKTPKPTKYDLVIPVGGIGLVLFAILEGVFIILSVVFA